MGLWGCPELSNPGQPPASLLMHLHVLILSDAAGLLGGCAGQTDWGHAESNLQLAVLIIRLIRPLVSLSL